MQKCNLGIKKRRIYADFESVEKVAKKRAKKVFSEKVKEIWSFLLLVLYGKVVGLILLLRELFLWARL